MQIFERAEQLALLTKCFDRVLDGQGTCALVHGEAGVGKTALVSRMVSALPASTCRLVAGCEDLFAPRPLGPLVDLAEQLPDALSVALREARTYNGLYPEFLAYLRGAPTPKVLVIEDLHWADESTLDFTRYIGRRLADVPVLLVLTYRDDDLGADHPLRRLLGDLPSASTVRVPVSCLSRTTVAAMARDAGRDVAGIFEATGGNPFFVTEVLSGQDAGVPPSVYDAVMTRMSRLSPPARAVVELASVSPGSIERSCVELLIDGSSPLVDECIEKGMLRSVGPMLAFRHELARKAVERSLAPGRSAHWHRRVFGALRRGDTGKGDLPRQVHHAERGGLEQEVSALAPHAARAAAELSAHREAASLYVLAVKSVAATDVATRAQLLESAAVEFRLISAVDESLAATREALALRLQMGDALHAGMNHRILAATQWREHADRQAAEAGIVLAIDGLEQIAPSTELARAYAELSRMHSAWSEYDASIEIGEKALALAESLGDPRCLVEALHALAAAKMFVRDDRNARAQLERALDVALEQRMEEAVGHLYSTLQLVSVIYRDHAYALDVAKRGIEYCEACDLDLYLYRLLDNRALSLMDLGRWDEADRDIDRCLAASVIASRLRNSLIFLRARQDMRRGVPSAGAYWQKLQDAPSAVPMGYRLPAIAAACAEAAWLRGDYHAAERVIQSGLQDALARNDARLLGPLLVWQKRIGASVPSFSQTISPAHASELAGDVQGAADHWAALSCVYERALTLLHGNEAQIREALGVLDALGAKPAANIARTRLRNSGARGVQRGPQPRTRSDALGLTARERAVYELVIHGLTNAAIAAKLHRSERTVEHHVARVLAKLKAKSRIELMARTADPGH